MIKYPPSPHTSMVGMLSISEKGKPRNFVTLDLRMGQHVRFSSFLQLVITQTLFSWINYRGRGGRGKPRESEDGGGEREEEMERVVRGEKETEGRREIRERVSERGMGGEEGEGVIKGGAREREMKGVRTCGRRAKKVRS